MPIVFGVVAFIIIAVVVVALVLKYKKKSNKVENDEKLIDYNNDNDNFNIFNDDNDNDNFNIFNDDSIFNDNNAAPKIGSNKKPIYDDAQKSLLKYKSGCGVLSTLIGNKKERRFFANFMCKPRNQGKIDLAQTRFGFNRTISGIFGYYLSQTESEDESTVLSATRSAYSLASYLFEKKSKTLRKDDYCGLIILRDNITKFKDCFSKLTDKEKKVLDNIRKNTDLTYGDYMILIN